MVANNLVQMACLPTNDSFCFPRPIFLQKAKTCAASKVDDIFLKFYDNFYVRIVRIFLKNIYYKCTHIYFTAGIKLIIFSF